MSFVDFVRYYEDYEIDEVKGLSNLTQLYTEVMCIGVLRNVLVVTVNLHSWNKSYVRFLLSFV